MKTIHYILLIIWLAATKIIAAQPILTNAGKLRIHDTYSYMIADSSALQAGSGGQNITWDFSTLKASGNLYNAQVLLPSQTAYELDFPKASMVYVDNMGGNNFKADKNDTTWMWGYVVTNENIVVKYNNPQIELIRPVAYTNKYSGFTTYGYTFQGSFNFHGGGKYSVEVDGYGTLKLPNGSFNNVLRVKSVQEMYDTLDGQNKASVTTKTTRYDWYNQYNAAPIMILDSVSVVSPGFTNVSQNIYYLQNPFTSVRQIVENKPVVKLIFDDNNLIVRGLNENLPATVEVYDITGKLLASTVVLQADEAVCGLSAAQYAGRVLLIRVINGSVAQTFKHIIY